MTEINVPRLRFKGFSGNLKSLTYNDVFDEFSYGLSKSGKSYDGKNKYLRITDITDDSRSFNKENLVSPDIDFEDKNNDSYLLNENDIVFARTGASTGKTYLYDKKDGRVYYAGFLIKGHVNHSFDSKYIFTSTLTDMYNNFIKVTSMRSGQPGINSKEYSMYSLNIPSKDEQQKVGSFFAKIDNLIELQTQKLEQLKKLKRGYLQKMFPQDGESVPRLRFSGFSGEWIQKPLSDIGSVYGGLSGKTKEDFGHGNSRFVPYISLNRNYVSNDNNTELVNVEDSEKQNLVQKNDVLFTISSETPEEVGLSSTWLGNKKTYLNSFSFGYRFNSPTDGHFTSSLFRSRDARSKIYPLAQGISRYNLSKKAFLGLKFRFPRLDEQKQIGSFLSKLDQIINNQSNKVEQLKQQKKAYLQKMFI